ncbi:MAG: hypothetical protein KGJ59_00060 [Bacteroidota bacterium]|nr:hypothetical protein [Bacteroidota bacterium]
MKYIAGFLKTPLGLFAFSIFFLSGSNSVGVFGQTGSASAKIELYSLHLSITPERHSFSAEAQMRIRLLKDSLSVLHFSFSRILDFDSARDTTGGKLSRKITRLDDGTTDVDVSIPGALRSGALFFLRLLYNAEIDSPLTSSTFITDGNILLPPPKQRIGFAQARLPADHDARWWPILLSGVDSSEQTANVTLSVALPASYVAVSSGECDTAHLPDGPIEWSFHHKHNMPVNNAFLFCASKEFSEKSFVSADSSVHVSLYFSPAQFSSDLAGYVVHQLGAAAEFFSALTLTPSEISRFPIEHHSEKSLQFRFAVIGSGEKNAEQFSRDGTFIIKNSPAFTVLDSSLLQLSADNMWVHDLSHSFGIAATDSTFWFNEGWASYLSSRFFLEKTDATGAQRQHERLRLMAGALDFYPTYPVAAERQRKNETAVFSRKGGYVFSMLEYILGKESFDEVIYKMYSAYHATPITIPEFQQLCEEAYGTPLDWFFDEWVYRTGFPELVFSSDVVPTVRGSYTVRVRVVQRGDVYVTPADVVITTASRAVPKRIFLQRQDQTFEFVVADKPLNVEFDPEYNVLRWVPQLRLLAHARTSESYRVFSHDVVNAEKEALLALQLDPYNLTGSNPPALFSLGKIAVLRNDLVKADSYFRQASLLEAAEQERWIPSMSLVRLGNAIEMKGRRDEALQLYRQALSVAGRTPAEAAVTIIEAEKYLSEPFVSSDDVWYGKY